MRGSGLGEGGKVNKGFLFDDILHDASIMYFEDVFSMCMGGVDTGSQCPQCYG